MEDINLVYADKTPTEAISHSILPHTSEKGSEQFFNQVQS